MGQDDRTEDDQQDQNKVPEQGPPPLLRILFLPKIPSFCLFPTSSVFLGVLCGELLSEAETYRPLPSNAQED